MIRSLLYALCIGASAIASASAQELDLSHGGPIAVTARDQIEWHQAEQQVIAVGDAKAVRDNVTVTADRLIAWYRKKSGAAAGTPQQPQSGLAGNTDTEGNEVYRVQAEGNVHIYTQTDQAQGDKATYDMDQAVLVMTGHNLKLTTPDEVITARDDLEYWSQRHMAVARGDAVAVSRDGRRLSADTLVAYTTDNSQPQANSQPQIRHATPVAAQPGAPGSQQDTLATSGKLQKVEAYGNVVVRTVTDTVTGDRAVYVPDSGIARVFGKVHITRGQNQLDGSEAEVNTKTGISRLLAANSGRVQGLVVPNDQSVPPPAPPPAAGHKP